MLEHPGSSESHANFSSQLFSLPAVRLPLESFSSLASKDSLTTTTFDQASAKSPRADPAAKNNAGLCGKLGIRAIFDPSSGALLVKSW